MGQQEYMRKTREEKRMYKQCIKRVSALGIITVLLVHMVSMDAAAAAPAVHVDESVYVNLD